MCMVFWVCLGINMVGEIVSMLVAVVFSMAAPLGLSVSGLWRSLRVLVVFPLFAGAVGALVKLIYHLAGAGPQPVQPDQMPSLVLHRLYLLQDFLWQWLIDSLVSAASSWTVLVARILNAEQEPWEITRI